ncbi:hypothetical protein ACJX0J_010610, partial [Zea mays]
FVHSICFHGYIIFICLIMYLNELYVKRENSILTGGFLNWDLVGAYIFASPLTSLLVTFAGQWAYASMVYEQSLGLFGTFIPQGLSFFLNRKMIIKGLALLGLVLRLQYMGIILEVGICAV